MSREDAKRWATLAGRLGEDVTYWICSDGPKSGSLGKLVPGLSAETLDFESDRAAAVGASIARMAATCARWSVGDTDNRARVFTRANDERVFFAVVNLADCNADGTPGDGESAAAWWAWFLAARGVLWAHVNPRDLEKCEDAPPPAVAAIAKEYPYVGSRPPMPVSDLVMSETLKKRQHEYFGIRREWKIGETTRAWTDNTGTVGIKMKPGGKVVGGKRRRARRASGRAEPAGPKTRPRPPRPPAGSRVAELEAENAWLRGYSDVSNEIAEAMQETSDAAEAESNALREENELLRARLEELEAGRPVAPGRPADGSKLPVCHVCEKRPATAKGTSPPACRFCVAKGIFTILLLVGAIGLIVYSC